METKRRHPETVRTQLETENKSLKNEIERLSTSLQGAPDPREFSRLQARSEELDRHNSTLKEELNKASQDKEDLKQMHNNYFLQIQTLINQKAIGSPQKAKESKKEETSTAEKGTTPPKGENDLIEKICKNCNQVFYTGNIKKETCSSKCRSAYSRKMKNMED